MKHYRLEDLPETTVSHAPGIKKRVFAQGQKISCIEKMSRAVLEPGDTARPHAHEGGYEIFYCAGGEALFRINGVDIGLGGGDCLVVEPGDVHEIKLVRTRTELFYFFAAAG
ncbi:MAG: cupin domain-containing protein [Nitrospiraceae bacterium]|nr:cupin domain-containing protein [Nitrospiraceae bacterium]